jgi:hypothetical protein
MKMLPNAQPKKLATLTNDWKCHAISTFEYLLQINKHSGRSFNNASEYPIFPWVIRDFESSTLNIENPDIYRDFSKALELSSGVHMDQTNAWSSPLLVLGHLYGEQRVSSVRNMWNALLTKPMDFREIAPEFFFFAELLFTRDVELPKWAHSAFDFVYWHRKALESEITSRKIHEWIDFVFGTNQKRERLDSPPDSRIGLPTIIFTHRHPKRGKPRFPAKSLVFRLDLGSLIFAHVFETTEKSIALTSIDSHGAFTVSYIHLRDSEDGGEKISCKAHNVDWADPRLAIVGVTDKVLISLGETVVYDRGEISPFPRHSRCIAANKRWVVVPTSESLISAFRTCDLKSPLWNLPYYRDGIVATCVSSKFHAYVLATKSSELLICPLERGSSPIIVQLEPCRVKKMAITPSWGFITVYYEKRMGTKVGYGIALYSINGTRLKGVSVTDEVIAMTVWSSRAGFDWIAVAVRSGSVLCAEAYLLNFGKPLLSSRVGFVELVYNRKAGMLVAVARDGTIFCHTVDMSE